MKHFITMFQKAYNIVKINLPGGIVSAGDLMTIVTVADKYNIEDIQFGNRQQLYLKVKTDKLSLLEEELASAGIFFETDKDESPNIMSSYVAEGVFHSGNWLSEGVYRDILDHFDYRPRLRINISDSGQTFTPFFTGHLNFVSSDQNNYWHLYIRFPKTSRIHSWNNLVYTGDIPRLSRLIEEIIFSNKDQYYGQENVSIESLYSAIKSRETFYVQPLEHDLKLPQFSLPYYEGFNQYNNKTWLGIYRRDELFPVAFIKDICAICKETKIGQIYTTPWKSIIIKGIETYHRKLWDYVLGKFRINVRHASNELCWQLEDLNDDALNLKRYLIRHFDRDDVRTYGLCFAIETQPKTRLLGSVVIRKLPNESRNQRRALDRYDILYTKDFNPNSREYLIFRKEISKEYLDTYLFSLCKFYYELSSAEDLIPYGAYQEENSTEGGYQPQTRVVHQCRDCFTIYDPVYGDAVNAISAATSFDDLPAHYECPTCNASKENFHAIEQPYLV